MNNRNVEEIYKGSRDKFLQRLVGLREEQEKIRLEAVDIKLENLVTKTAVAKLEYKIQKNYNDIKSMKRNGCTKGQTHSIIRSEMEDGRVIILRSTCLVRLIIGFEFLFASQGGQCLS